MYVVDEVALSTERRRGRGLPYIQRRRFESCDGPGELFCEIRLGVGNEMENRL